MDFEFEPTPSASAQVETGGETPLFNIAPRSTTNFINSGPSAGDVQQGENCRTVFSVNNVPLAFAQLGIGGETMYMDGAGAPATKGDETRIREYLVRGIRGEFTTSTGAQYTTTNELEQMARSLELNNSSASPARDTGIKPPSKEIRESTIAVSPTASMLETLPPTFLQTMSESPFNIFKATRNLFRNLWN